MGLPKFRYAVLLALITGIVVPVVFMLCFRWRLFPAGDWLLFIWPTSLMLMATENLGYSPEAFGIVALSIFYNAVLYMVVFTLIWCIGWAMRAWRASLRDGTTI
jgi:hypothetical protein